MRYRGKFYLAVRGVVFLCVLLALFGIRIYKGSGMTAAWISDVTGGFYR